MVGSFRRSLTFPGHHIQPEKLTAALQNGVLKITIPKHPVKGTKVDIVEE